METLRRIFIIQPVRGRWQWKAIEEHHMCIIGLDFIRNHNATIARNAMAVNFAEEPVKILPANFELILKSYCLQRVLL